MQQILQRSITKLQGHNKVLWKRNPRAKPTWLPLPCAFNCHQNDFLHCFFELFL